MKKIIELKNVTKSFDGEAVLDNISLDIYDNEFITLLKDTSLVSAIGGTEMVYFAQAIGGKTYEYMFPLLGIAVMYLILVMILSWLQGKMERRLRQSDRR